MTSPERCLLDLAEILWHRRLVDAVERAVRMNLVTPRSLLTLCDRTTGRRGLARLRRVAGRARDGESLSRSPLERRLLRLCREAGLPAPAVNVPVAGYEADALWPDARLVVEMDGFVHHKSRAAFEADRRRDMALALEGYKVVRLTHRRLAEDSEAVVRGLRELIAPAGKSVSA